jgi:hypothetical protein
LLRSEDGVIDTFRVNPAVVPRQEQQAFIPIYVLRTIENRSEPAVEPPLVGLDGRSESGQN